MSARPQCLNDITLTTQEEVNTFPKNYGCINIEGNLSIGLQTEWSNISSVDSLYQIETIGGGLGIYANNVKDLSGLENLKSISNYFWIRHCDSLHNLQGLNNLISIGGEINIAMNDAFVNLSGLENLVESGGIVLQYNPLLESLSGLENLEILNGLYLKENQSLPNLSGLSKAISTTNYFAIEGNKRLTDLSNIAALKSVEFYFYINENDSLTNLSAFGNLSSVGSNMKIINNTALADISGFSNLRNIGRDFNLSGNSNLSDCCVVLDFINEIEGEIIIANNDTTCNSIEGVSNFCKNLLDSEALLNQNELLPVIFPNPNEGQFYIKSNTYNILSIKIQNHLGQVVFNQKKPDNILFVDLSHQKSKGLCFISIKTSTGVFVKKMCVQ